MLYGPTVGDEARTPDEVAEDAITTSRSRPSLEAIEYCIHNAEVLRQDYGSEVEDLRARGLDAPPPVLAAGGLRQS